MKKSSGPNEVVVRHLRDDIWLVPCVANYNTSQFMPLILPHTPHLSDTDVSAKGWNQAEDAILLKVVLARGAKAWNQVAKEINTLMYSGKEVKLGRQCRERWLNHIDPSLKKTGWTEEEDIRLLESQLELGNKWSEIARDLHGRTENSTKNRWKSIVKKASKERPQERDLIEKLLAEKRQELVQRNEVEHCFARWPLVGGRMVTQFSDACLELDNLNECDSLTRPRPEHSFYNNLDSPSYQDLFLDITSGV